MVLCFSRGLFRCPNNISYKSAGLLTTNRKLITGGDGMNYYQLAGWVMVVAGFVFSVAMFSSALMCNGDALSKYRYKQVWGETE